MAWHRQNVQTLDVITFVIKMSNILQSFIQIGNKKFFLENITLAYSLLFGLPKKN